MSLNKKGVDFGFVGKLIIALIIMGLLWVLFINVGDFLYGTGNKAACQNWVYKNSIVGIKEVINIGNSPCITTQETVKEIKNENDLYEKLARNMYECWDQYGRGESDFYKNLGNFNNFCSICSEIKFEEDIKNIDLDKFEIYLNNHNPPNHKETYANFLLNGESINLDFGKELIAQKEAPLYVMYTVSKRSAPTFEAALSKGGAVFGLAVLGSAVGTGIGVIFPPALSVAPYAGYLIGTSIGAIFVGGSAGYYFPGIFITSDNIDSVRNKCDYVYYNPEKNPLQFTKK